MNNHKNSALLNTIISFKKSYNIINNDLINNIFHQEKFINNVNEVYMDPIVNTKNIADFSTIKYFDTFKVSDGDNEFITERENHFKKRAEVLKKTPASLSEELERARIALFVSWNKGISKKKFIARELDQYIKKYRQYCEIIGDVFGSKNYYDALINYNHPKFSCSFIENLFKQIAPDLKKIYKTSSEYCKSIKTIKFDKSLIKDDQYSEIINQIKGNFDIQNDFVMNNSKQSFNIFSDEKFNLAKTFPEFPELIINDIIIESQNNLINRFGNKKEIFDNYNTQFLTMVISYFFGFYLLRSKQYIENLSIFLKKIVRCKGKISDAQNLFWLFNKLPEQPSINNNDEISSMFFCMIQHVIERDLINAQLKAEDVPDAWANGIKHYFSGQVANPENILHNFNWGLGKFGHPGFRATALIDSAMMFGQYEEHTEKETNYNKSYIKKFLSNIDSSNIDSSTSAMIDATSEASSLYLKLIKEKFSN